MEIINKLNLPEALVRACTTYRNTNPSSISVSNLLIGAKEKILTDRHYDEITVDVADNIWALFGTAVHKLLETEGDNDFTEVSLAYEYHDMTIRGRLDNYDMKHGIVTDYKTMSIWKVKFENFEDWRKQGLLYAWLLRKNGFEVNECKFIGFIKDWSKAESKRDYDYPQSQVYIYSFKVDDDLDRIQNLIDLKISEHQKYNLLSDDDIPPCEPNERWQTQTKYAVMKGSNKKATRVLSAYKEAEKYIGEQKGFSIVERLGENKKCENYCNCKEFCNFYKSAVEKEIIEKAKKIEDANEAKQDYEDALQDQSDALCYELETK